MVLVEVYESVGKSVISVCREAQKGRQMHYMAVKESRKCLVLVVQTAGG